MYNTFGRSEGDPVHIPEHLQRTVETFLAKNAKRDKDETPLHLMQLRPRGWTTGHDEVVEAVIGSAAGMQQQAERYVNESTPYSIC